MPKKPYKLRELLKKLKDYGVKALTKRGKGSEIILLKPVEEGSTKGPQYPIKNHGDSTEIDSRVIDKILDRFGIDQKEFWE